MLEETNLTNIGFETLEMCSTSAWRQSHLHVTCQVLFSESSYDYCIEAWPKGYSRHEHSWMHGFDTWRIVPKTCCRVLAWLGGPKLGKKKLGPKSIL
jgi:hypothetical protein